MAEAQAGLSTDNDIPEWTHSSGVGLTDTVARLQREVEDLRSDFMFNHTGGTPSSPGPFLRRLKCLGLRVRLAGNNTDRCSMPL